VKVVGVVAALALVFAACGDDDDEATTTSGTSADDGSSAAPTVVDDGESTATTVADDGESSATTVADDAGSTATTVADDGESSATTAADDGQPTGTVANDGEPIRLMVTGPFSSPSYATPQTLAGAKAAASSINDSGGVDGRSIELVECDDNFDANKAAACAQRAVDEGVTAVVGYSAFSSAVAPILEQAQIAFVNSTVISPVDLQSPVYYPLQGGAPIGYYALAVSMVQNGASNLAIIRSDAATAEYTAGFAERGTADAEGTVTANVAAPIGSPDMAPYVETALRSNPDALFVVMGASDLTKVVNAARQAGFEGPIGGLAAALQSSTLEALGENGNNMAAAGNYMVSPDGDDFVTDLAEYQPDFSSDDSNAEAAWVGVTAIANVLAGEADTSASALIAALDETTDLNVGPMLPTIDLTAESPFPDEYPRLVNPTAVIFEVQDGHLVADGSFFNPFEE
jgi:ABC-type branched-subunit amino acid transport system substrate-binding protein